MDRVANADEGNFLYVHLVLDDLCTRLSEACQLDVLTLPKGLSGLYHQFLNRELGKDEDRWYNDFKPLLGLIAVAQGEGLTRYQLEGVVNKDITQSLRICKQYLNGELPDGPFRIFHRSFSKSRRKKQEFFYVNPLTKAPKNADPELPARLSCPSLNCCAIA